MLTKKMLKVLAAFTLGLVLSGVLFAAQPPNREDQNITQMATQELRKSAKLKAVSAGTEDGIVLLSGQVDLYIDKVNAEKRVRKIKSVDGVRNHIDVAGKPVSDSELRDNLAAKLRYDRIGQGIVFNSLTVGVSNGTVTIGGNVRDYPDRDSAIAIAEITPGVKDVIDEIDVAPVSVRDDELRVRLATAIYGHPSLQRYAIDPQAPIRIVVTDGTVQLTGVVLTDGDRQTANAMANSVPGVFRVDNKLTVGS